jgi:DNA-binding Lrp family transcriptional regulator
VNALKNGRFEFPNYLKGVREVERQLDPTNAKILSAMWRFSPRNLLRVSRQTKIPFTSVYHRVAKLEAKNGRIAYLIPRNSKLGLVRTVAFVTSRAGSEEHVTRALKIPNLWRCINPCEGTFTHLSVHTVPINHVKDFKGYFRELVDSGLITRFRLIETGDYVPNFPDFKYYDTHRRVWTFPWSRWILLLKRGKPIRQMQDPEDYPLLADLKDMIIVKELEKNARKSFADLAPMLGITLQGVKYRYDRRLVPSGIVQYFDYDVRCYPVEISACHEVMLEFTTTEIMNKFFSFIDELFFVVGVGKVVRRNTLIARTYLPQSQVANMFAFFSEMAKSSMISAYSSVRLDLVGRETQTISYELFEDERGWTVDFRHCISELHELAKEEKPLGPQENSNSRRMTSGETAITRSQAFHTEETP